MLFDSKEIFFLVKMTYYLPFGLRRKKYFYRARNY